MAIPESQLETWSHQGSVTQSSTTYNSVKNVLEATDSPYASEDYSVYLQGSYGNHTNIFAESDVDIVITLDDVWHSDLQALSQAEKDAYNSAYSSATYTGKDFRRDVHTVLANKYGSDVTLGNKAIAISANGNRRSVDVIVATQYRRYHRFINSNDQYCEKGICFYNSSGSRIANYPKAHSANLTRKHQDSGNRLKPMIRVFKNLRKKLVSDGLIGSGLAPSYYLEGLLYNAPEEKFSARDEDSFVNIINWLINDADTSKLVCANEQYKLLWDNTHTSWPKANYESFLSAAIKLWKEW